jgi:tape measure domain-containing protein
VASLDEVGVRLTARDELTKTLREVRREANAMARELRDVGGTDVNRGVGDLGGRFSALRGELGGVHSALLSTSSALGTFVSRGALGLGALSAAAVGFGLRAASGFEQSEIAFGTLLGSMQQGEALFDRLQQFNLQTPFELPDLTGATQQLLQYGFTGEQAFSSIKSVADVAATSGVRAQENLGRITYALGQIRNQGTLRADDIRQLTDAGFPALQLLSEVSGLTGMEIRKNLETGLDPQIATNFLAAVETGQAQAFTRFRGGAAAQARTLSGIYSNLKDTVQIQLAENLNPLAGGLADDVPAIAASLGSLIDAVVPPLGDLVGMLAKGAPDGIRQITPALVDLAEASVLLVTEVGPLMPELIGAFTDFLELLPDLLAVATDLLPIVGGMARAFSDFLDLPFGSDAAAVLLTTLLGYRALTSVAGIITGISDAMNAFNGAGGDGGPDGAGGDRRGGTPLLVGGARLAGAAGLAALGLQLAEGAQTALSSDGRSQRDIIEANQFARGERGALSGVNSFLTSALSSGLGGLPLIGGSIRSQLGADAEGQFRPSTAALRTTGGGTVVHSRTSVGDINVINPSSDVDVKRAIREALEDAESERDLRGSVGAGLGAP